MIQEWIFLAVSIVNIVATIGLTIERIVVTVQSDPSNPDFTFALLLLINAGSYAVCQDLCTQGSISTDVKPNEQ